MHPFVVYLKDGDQTKSFSTCVISDCLDHSTNSFHCFLSKLVDWLKLDYSNINLIKLFTDGAVSQYKNFKNFINVAHFKKDFDLDAELHFFASGHGKNSGDGVAGALKREVRNASLREKLIATPLEFFNYCAAKSSVKCFWVSNSDVEQHVIKFKLEERYSLGSTVHGTQQMHKVIAWTSTLGVDLCPVTLSL